MDEPAGAGTPPRVMTIAGTDSGGSAGAAADLRALAACGVHGCLAVTAVTVQDSLRVRGVHLVPPETVAAQIETVASDMGLQAVKTGMLAGTATIEAIAGACERVGIGGDGVPFLVDPVAASMHGDQLLEDAALDAFRDLLFPRATLITPNLDEVRLLVGLAVHDRAAQYEAARKLHALGPRYVLVKGGHLVEDTDVCVDLLFDGEEFVELPGPRYPTRHLHGSGDVMGAGIAAALARGASVPDAVAFGKRFVVESVRNAYPVGAGTGPVSPLWAVRDWWT
jgi:hydroxymethylpyrimidine/phosphomethylpyrimidine kinase